MAAAREEGYAAGFLAASTMTFTVGAQVTESEEVLSTAQGGDWEFRGIRKPKPPQP